MAIIEHVIVLMLENRSFDCLLGKLYAPGSGFNGLTGLESNPYNNAPVGVWRASAMDSDVAIIPDPDPGEEFDDMNEQLFGPGPRAHRRSSLDDGLCPELHATARRG